MIELILLQKTFTYFEIELSEILKNGRELEDVLKNNDEKIFLSFFVNLNSYLESLQEVIAPLAFSVVMMGLIIYSIFFDKG